MSRMGIKLAMAAFAAAPTRAALSLKRSLLADPEVTPLDSLTSAQLRRQRLPFVFLNGEWLGCCADVCRLVMRYRALRDAGAEDVDSRTVIDVDLASGEILFWLDADRPPTGASRHGSRRGARRRPRR
jgi:hypothetical protein